MTQPSLLDVPPQFDGESFDLALDQDRLASQLDRVKRLMGDGRYRTLAEIRAAVGGSEAGISARLRDLRKHRNGAHTVNRRRRTEGTYEYAMEKAS